MEGLARIQAATAVASRPANLDRLATLQVDDDGAVVVTLGNRPVVDAHDQEVLASGHS